MKYELLNYKDVLRNMIANIPNTLKTHIEGFGNDEFDCLTFEHARQDYEIYFFVQSKEDKLSNMKHATLGEMYKLRMRLGADEEKIAKNADDIHRSDYVIPYLLSIDVFKTWARLSGGKQCTTNWMYMGEMKRVSRWEKSFGVIAKKKSVWEIEPSDATFDVNCVEMPSLDFGGDEVLMVISADTCLKEYYCCFESAFSYPRFYVPLVKKGSVFSEIKSFEYSLEFSMHLYGDEKAIVFDDNADAIRCLNEYHRNFPKVDCRMKGGTFSFGSGGFSARYPIKYDTRLQRDAISGGVA